MMNTVVAMKLSTPVYQDANGDTCLEPDVLGCKVMHKITHPDICFVMDNVDGNMNQKGYGYIGSKLLVCGREMTPQR